MSEQEPKIEEKTEVERNKEDKEETKEKIELEKKEVTQEKAESDKNEEKQEKKEDQNKEKEETKETKEKTEQEKKEEIQKEIKGTEKKEEIQEKKDNEKEKIQNSNNENTINDKNKKEENEEKNDAKESEEKKEEESEKKNPRNKNFNPEDYILMLSIGTGNFSEVHMVEHKVTKILYALKSFQKRRVESLHKERDVLMEKYAMEKIDPNPYIIGYYGSAKDDFEMFILYEYINGGDLWHKSVIYGMPCEKLIKYYFIQLLKGIKHIHSFNIAHRDIKPENIMVTKDEKLIKIIDFGSSLDLDGTDFEGKIAEMKKKEKKKRPDFLHFVGTPNYMAPECVHNQFSDKRCDIWSLGCVLFDLITGFPPFNGASEYLIFQKSIEAKYIFPEGVVPELAKDLIQKCIVIDPAKRPTIDEILNHPYLKEEVNDPHFFDDLPKMTEKEKIFFDIKNKLKEYFGKYKDISNNLDAIKDHEKMEEDLKRNDIKPEPSPEDEKMKLLCSKKEEYLKEYNDGLEELKNKIKEFKKSEDNEENITFNKKLDFLEVRIKHDLFNQVYRGFEFPPKHNEINFEENSYSSDEDKKEKKK